MDKKFVYRYISFEAFVQIVVMNELPFVNPLKCWPDKYEGRLFRFLKDTNQKKRIEELIRQRIPEKDETYCKKVIFKADMARCECWTYNRDEAVMWNAYSYNQKAIMIRTSKWKMSKLPVKVRKIHYFNEVPIEAEVDALVSKNGMNIQKVFACKRKQFRYENEIRYFVEEKYLREKERPDVVMIPIDSANEFIEEVLVHPEASEWYVKTVEKLCEDYKIPFMGQSSLYKL